ncbi:unnamed protein product [Strongylus vulgaris]|uniref:Uncharacterized protein n=1 Tax=Strongylus vulgaris TaxID=40348 RepID=A0A3P7IVB0_STRVU|nr:unnamed protein product [Strongylus vulgaris]
MIDRKVLQWSEILSFEGAVTAFMVWIAARTSAGRILGGISPVEITGVDTGVDERKRLVIVVSGTDSRDGAASSFDCLTFEDFLAKLFYNWYWLPVARDVMQSVPASVLFSSQADLVAFEISSKFLVQDIEA